MAQTVEHRPGQGPKGEDYCLVNSDGSVSGWFATHEDAVSAMRKTTQASRMYSEEDVEHFLAPVASFEFADDGVWIEALEAKEYHTSEYGKVPITKAKLSNLAASVKSNVRGVELSTDYVHGRDPAKGMKASGTIKDAKVEGDKLLLNVDFTETAKAEIKAGEWKYFSSDWLDSYTHEDGSKHTDVLLGGGLTNRPVAKGLSKLPVNFSELFTETGHEFSQLSYAQRKALPDSAFLYIEKDGTRHLPVPDVEHIRSAITRLSQKATGTVKGESWLTPSLRSSLLAKARAMLSRKKMSEGGDMNEEQMKKLAEALGITFSEDITGEAFGELVLTSVGKLNSEIEPLRELEKSSEKARKFSEEFPEEYAQMQEDKKFRIESASNKFAETIGSKRFSESVGKKDKEGNDVIVVTNKGLSGKAIETIRDTHLKFSEGSVTVEDFNNTVNAILDGGIVEYGEKGSSLGNDNLVSKGDVKPDGNLYEQRQAFAEKVQETRKQMSEDSGKDVGFREAMVAAAKEYPNLYDAYIGAGSRGDS